MSKVSYQTSFHFIERHTITRTVRRVFPAAVGRTMKAQNIDINAIISAWIRICWMCPLLYSVHLQKKRRFTSSLRATTCSPSCTCSSIIQCCSRRSSGLLEYRIELQHVISRIKPIFLNVVIMAEAMLWRPQWFGAFRTVLLECGAAVPVH